MENTLKKEKIVKYLLEIDALIDQVNDDSDVETVAKLMADGACESTENIKEYTVTRLEASYVTITELNCLSVQDDNNFSGGDNEDIGTTY